MQEVEASIGKPDRIESEVLHVGDLRGPTIKIWVYDRFPVLANGTRTPGRIQFMQTLWLNLDDRAIRTQTDDAEVYRAFSFQGTFPIAKEWQKKSAQHEQSSQAGHARGKCRCLTSRWSWRRPGGMQSWALHSVVLMAAAAQRHVDMAD